MFQKNHRDCVQMCHEISGSVIGSVCFIIGARCLLIVSVSRYACCFPCSIINGEWEFLFAPFMLYKPKPPSSHARGLFLYFYQYILHVFFVSFITLNTLFNYLSCVFISPGSPAPLAQHEVIETQTVSLLRTHMFYITTYNLSILSLFSMDLSDIELCWLLPWCVTT